MGKPAVGFLLRRRLSLPDHSAPLPEPTSSSRPERRRHALDSCGFLVHFHAAYAKAMQRNQGVFMAKDHSTNTDKNRDPLSGEPGSHPVGTGLGPRRQPDQQQPAELQRGGGHDGHGTVDNVDAVAASGDAMDNDDVIDTLNDLLESCRDGEFGYRECAEHVKAENLKTVLHRHEQACRDAGAELKTLIVQLGGQADEGGTVTGALHRGWVSARGTLLGNSDQAMLDECERGEDAALARYRKALKAQLPERVRSVVQRQSDGAQRKHDQIKALRDSLRASA
jgi:uncharacterized protein (TIGR02284 family)